MITSSLLFLLGWDYGCLSMTIGEKASLRIAPELGYGKDGFPAWKYPFITKFRNKISSIKCYTIVAC